MLCPEEPYLVCVRACMCVWGGERCGRMCVCVCVSVIECDQVQQ